VVRDIASYNSLALLADSICKKFHERLCNKILDEVDNYRVIFIGKRVWKAYRWQGMGLGAVVVRAVPCMYWDHGALLSEAMVGGDLGE